MKLFCLIVLLVLEAPFYFKIRKEFDIIRQTAIAVIMLIIPIIVFIIYKIGLFVIG
jgi:hypothetical protein